MATKWIQKAHIKKGALHKELGIPTDKKIPTSRLKKAEKSKNPTLKKRAILAETFKKMNHKKEK
jgi:hypothetical protein